LFLALAALLVAPALRGGHAQIDDRIARIEPAHFRVLAQIADQNHLVDAASHRRPPVSFACSMVEASAGQPTTDLSMFYPPTREIGKESINAEGCLDWGNGLSGRADNAPAPHRSNPPGPSGGRPPARRREPEARNMSEL